MPGYDVERERIVLNNAGNHWYHPYPHMMTPAAGQIVTGLAHVVRDLAGSRACRCEYGVEGFSGRIAGS